MSMFPPDHALRATLAEEIHARPPEAVQAPARASYVAVLVESEQRTREFGHLCTLCDSLGVEPPVPGASHFRAEFKTERGHFRLKWERHGEFSGYTVIVTKAYPRTPFSKRSAASAAARGLAGCAARRHHRRGTRQAAGRARTKNAWPATARAGLRQGRPWPPPKWPTARPACLHRFPACYEGCTRFVLIDRQLTERQAGRTLQRLFEIEAYRMLALLALPIARKQSPRIVQIEAALAQLTDGIALRPG